MEKKRVGIVTFSHANNNGAFLQSYALQTFLEKKGYLVEHILNSNEKFRLNKRVNVKKKFKSLEEKNEIVLNNLYEEYRKKYINFKKTIDTGSLYCLHKNFSNYDAIIAGSDQIWNTNITRGVFEQYYFLSHVPNNIKKITYACSFGTADLYTTYNAEILKCLLKDIDYISVREKSAQKYLSGFYNNCPVEHHIDPTFLIDRNDYDKLLVNDEKYKKDKYIYLYMVGENDEIIDYTKKLSEKYNLKVCHNYKKGTFKNEDCSPMVVGDFLSKIKNAEVIICSSYHALIFSLIYRKKVIVFGINNPERMTALTELFNIKHLYNPIELIDINKIKIDYKKIDKIVLSERNKSEQYLVNAIEGNKKNKNDSYFDTKDKFSCYGCSACSVVCPTGAITMKEDEEGFIYPFIDSSKCINCGLCKKKCIYKNKKLVNNIKFEKEAYAAFLSDDNLIKDSSSGGIFKALSDYILKNDGFVVGVRYDENVIPFYDISNDENIVNKFRGSKYALPNINDIYKKTKEKLELGVPVLFTGSSCVIAGLKTFLNKKYNNLYLMDFICHGYVSQKVYNDYKKYLEEKYHKRIVNISFKNKRNGWKNHAFVVTFAYGEEFVENCSDNEYFKCFVQDKLQKRSCYNCEFYLDNKPSDITICDFWGIDTVHPDMFNNDKGVSGVILNTQVGKELFDSISGKLVIKKVSIEDIFNNNLNARIVLKEDRFKFYDYQKNPPIDFMLNSFSDIKPKIRYKNVSISRQIVRKVFPKSIRRIIKNSIKR